jgi:hypothetical protein
MHAAAPEKSRQVEARAVAAIVFLVLLLRLPFLNQAIQGDDFYYLKGAEHALIDPLHPTHASYVFQGVRVDMRGHPHPPLNSWILAALLVVFKDVHEIPFHAAYIPFSILAALSAYAIARRFCVQPLAATVLFLATPAFVINGTSLEADLPFAAFWLAAIACFVYERYALAALAAAFAALTAYQAIVLAPILLCYDWRTRKAWAAALAAPVTVAGYQIFERMTSGALPAAVLAGYMNTYNLQTVAMKLKNAAALTAHLGWIVFPLAAVLAFRKQAKWGLFAIAAALYDPNPLFWGSILIGLMVIAYAIEHYRDFLSQWILIFFAGALIIFFAGSARYLLPIATPVAILAARRLSPKWIYASAAAGAALSLSLAIVNYQHWDGYRRVKAEGARVFVNAEWGLRHYLESEGALPVVNGESFRAGDTIVSSAYANPIADGRLTLVASREITSAIPLRIAAQGAKSGYSSVAFGLRPFDISRAPMDHVTIQTIAERKPELSVLKIGTPEAAAQILSGIYNNDRWTGEKATVLLKHPPGAASLEVSFYIPPQAPARTVSLSANGRLLKLQTYPGPGLYKITAPAPDGDSAAITFAVDKTFSVPPDQRQLGVLLIEIGFH